MPTFNVKVGETISIESRAFSEDQDVNISYSGDLSRILYTASRDTRRVDIKGLIPGDTILKAIYGGKSEELSINVIPSDGE